MGKLVLTESMRVRVGYMRYALAASENTIHVTARVAFRQLSFPQETVSRTSRHIFHNER